MVGLLVVVTIVLADVVPPRFVRGSSRPWRFAEKAKARSEQFGGGRRDGGES